MAALSLPVTKLLEALMLWLVSHQWHHSTRTDLSLMPRVISVMEGAYHQEGNMKTGNKTSADVISWLVRWTNRPAETPLRSTGTWRVA